MQIKKFNRIYCIYIVLATAIIFIVAERECMVIQFEIDRIYKIVLSTMGCMVALLFNIYTMRKTRNANWSYKILFQILSHVINIYSIIILIYMYIPIINNTDQYKIGLFRTVQDNLFVILYLQWIRINVVGDYSNKLKEAQQILRRHKEVMTMYFICLFCAFTCLFTFGWKYEKNTYFRNYTYFYNKVN